MDYWRATKTVMRYIQRTKDFMLLVSSCDELEIVGYADFDFARRSDDLKSTSSCV